MEMKYQVGEQVWIATTQRTRKYTECQVCYGTKVVHLTLGNGDVLELPCGYCSHGFAPPSGKEVDYWYEIGDFHRKVVKGVRVEAKGIRYEVGDSLDSPAGWIRDESDVFATIDEAKDAADRLAEEANEYRATEHLRKPKEKDHRSYAWHVGYYKREIKKCEKELKRYREKLVICEEKAR